MLAAYDALLKAARGERTIRSLRDGARMISDGCESAEISPQTALRLAEAIDQVWDRLLDESHRTLDRAIVCFGLFNLGLLVALREGCISPPHVTFHDLQEVNRAFMKHLEVAEILEALDERASPAFTYLLNSFDFAVRRPASVAQVH